jgi:hypothetical protein
MTSRWSLWCILFHSTSSSFQFYRPLTRIYRGTMASAQPSTMENNNDEFTPKPRLVVFDLDACVWFPEMYHVRITFSL